MKLHSRLLLAALLATASAGAWCAPVNVNTADAATIAENLSGIGTVKAQAIVDYRQRHGPFRSINELAQVKGISQKLINRNRSDLRVDRAPVNAAVAAPAHPAAKPASHK